jgi:hypothetical protein
VVDRYCVILVVRIHAEPATDTTVMAGMVRMA